MVHYHIYIIVLVLLSGCTYLPQIAPPPATPSPLPTPTEQPSLRGTGGTLHLISWDAPSTLNPHLSSANKDYEASRIVYEPLASFDANGEMVPFLAAEIPSYENGDVAEDGLSVTWRLRQDVQWSDGSEFTAEDVLFTYEFITNPDVSISSVSSTAYAQVSDVEIVDKYTITVHFSTPTPAWYLPFVGVPGLILPRHIFANYNGSNYENAPANMGRKDGDTVGTGPYRVISFKPQETLFLATQLVPTNKIVYEPNRYFREDDKPYFSRIELLGGGTLDQAARSILTSDNGAEGDYYAFDLQETAEGLQELIDLGERRSYVTFGSSLILLDLNHSDPDQNSSLDAPHSFFSDKRVRQAFAYAIDREAITRQLYGELGLPAYQIVVAPEAYQSPTLFYDYDPDQAAALFDEAGWIDSDGDGFREKDGQPLRVVYEAEVNSRRLQQLVREYLGAIGVDVEIKPVDPGIFFGEDQSHPDSSGRFLADLQSYRITMDTIDPAYYLGWWRCDQIAREENDWGGINVTRWCSDEFDELHQRTTEEIDEQARRQLIMEMNDIFIEDVVSIPLVHIAKMSASRNELEGVILTPWDADVWQIKDWKRSSTS